MSSRLAILKPDGTGDGIATGNDSGSGFKASVGLRGGRPGYSYTGPGTR